MNWARGALKEAGAQTRQFGPALLRLARNFIATVIAATALAFIGLEISIKGGFRAVLLPEGGSSSPRAQRLIETYHLDENVVVRYLYWLRDAVQGDFGRSAVNGESVTEAIGHRLPISLQLMLMGVGLTVLIAVPLAVMSVAWRDRRAGKVLNGFFGLVQSVPIYVTPLILVWLFALRLGWLPASGWVRISDSLTGNLKNAAMPLMAIVLAELGIIARVVRNDVTRVLEMDYIAAALGKGLSYPYVLFRHGLRPASLGLLNVLGLNIGSLLSGALIVELIFGIGGLGRVLFESTIGRDLPMLLGLTTFGVVVHKSLSTLVDAIMLFVDPRISRSPQSAL